MADVPKENYGGHSFDMLNNESNFAYTLMTAEEVTGEGINDAIYNRNLKVMDDLNIKITENMVSFAEVTTEMNTAIAAGDDTYDCFWNESYLIAPFAIEGNLLNINDITAINLDKPWWNKEALSDIAMGEYQYFLAGELHLMFKESYWMCGFNKNILDENNLGDPYELVREGTWTLDQMKTYMSTAARDLNGDGVMDGTDRFGMTCYKGCVPALMIAAGEHFVERGEDGIPVLATPGDRFYSVYEKLISTMFESTAKYVCLSEKTPKLATNWLDVFIGGQSLFFLNPIGSLKKMRDMDAEFGVLPLPKYDEAQENYTTYIANYAALCGIPITSKDPQRTGVILENLCAKSYGELRDAYSKTTLNFKYIRDLESSEMLNLIFESGVLNLADTLSVKTPMDTVTSNAINAKMELASTYAKSMKAATKMIEKNVKKLMKVEE